MGEATWGDLEAHLNAEIDRLTAINAELVTALYKFVLHYRHGINPDLDKAYGAAIDVIAKARGEDK